MWLLAPASSAVYKLAAKSALPTRAQLRCPTFKLTRPKGNLGARLSREHSQRTRQPMFVLPQLMAFTGPEATMRALRTLGPCKAPFSCVHIRHVKAPTPKSGQALVRVNATSVNPSDVDEVQLGACTLGCGADVSGTIVACDGCKSLKVGDEVWTLSHGAYSDFVVADEDRIGLKPPSISHHDAGTLPEVSLTSLFSLKRTASPPSSPLPPPGNPWTKSNLTVVVTAGSGGTGSVALQMARAWGAAHIATATTGAAGEAFVRSLGATIVTDYEKLDIFDALASDSVGVHGHTPTSCLAPGTSRRTPLRPCPRPRPRLSPHRSRRRRVRQLRRRRQRGQGDEGAAQRRRLPADAARRVPLLPPFALHPLLPLVQRHPPLAASRHVPPLLTRPSLQASAMRRRRRGHPASRRTRSRACARSLPAMLDSPPAPATPLTPA